MYCLNIMKIHGMIMPVLLNEIIPGSLPGDYLPYQIRNKIKHPMVLDGIKVGNYWRDGKNRQDFFGGNGSGGGIPGVSCG
jgi:hypothetical protein